MNRLMPFCPVGMARQLVADWEALYGGPWRLSATEFRGPGTVTSAVLSQFNGAPLAVQNIHIPGIPAHLTRCVCVALAKQGRLKRLQRGVYQRLDALEKPHA